MSPKTWDVVSIYTQIPRIPHEKHCIVLNAERREVFFINSEPPRARKAREIAVTIANFECHGLYKADSYVDTTDVRVMPADEWDAAVAKPDKNKGQLLSAVKTRCQGAIKGHGQLTSEQRQLLGVIDDDC
jgi:hypothetical protein